MPAAGRFAPTPSGPLHFGSLVAAVASYADARLQGDQWLLRIEDVDTPRVVAGSADNILRDLEAFGFEWDQLSWQSDHFEDYADYIDQLLEGGYCYPCECSRRTLRQQGVASGVLGQIYPANCRHKELPIDNHSIRLNTARAGCIGFHDRVYGKQSLNLEDEVGDFVLRRADGVFAYHLAVVVDDQRENISRVVRGADLLENTCLHIWLQQCLGFPVPQYLHLPLVIQPDGAKLSKQTGAEAVDSGRAGEQLFAALSHLGQHPPPTLKHEKPTDILHWAVNHWNPESIPAIRGNTAERLDL